MAGYSKRTLVEKLGIKASDKITFINYPIKYEKLLGPLPKGVIIGLIGEGNFDMVQIFATEMEELQTIFPILKKNIKPAGMIWVSWPKGTAKLKTDLNENRIRELGLHHGVVDVKVIAVDETWSGLKFVFRLKDRK
jgi:hypothetical protein